MQPLKKSQHAKLRIIDIAFGVNGDLGHLCDTNSFQTCGKFVKKCMLQRATLPVKPQVIVLRYVSGDDAEAQPTHVFLCVYFNVGCDRYNLLVN